ncbi:hypothetical protein DVT68_13185 [Dyella solisilvae]|uniref:Outer membrane lipoprotein-sorting protein n=1 Tax=Dyella solisilvae TaxID=1920168 RepID=A0A370K5V1_9GAMM|nr:hypothetical protein [Dyella solisilvae]RDI98033.1 hypothetical protein DVT68_13185 [Dyella solisilvae]
MNLLGRCFLSVVCLAFVGAAFAGDEGGASVIKQMHAKYQNDWFATTQFAQKTTHYDADGKAHVSQWYERIQVPGKLRIDIGPAEDGNAMILADGQMHTFKQGKQVASDRLVSLAMLLGFDVYRQSPDVTLALLKQEGIDTAKVHEESWQGRPVYVVGADRGDLNAHQFWIDRERLLLARIIQPVKDKPGESADIRFLDYRAQPHGLIAARIDVYQKNLLVMAEEYSDIETDVPLDAAWFDPTKLSTPASGK